MPEQPRLDFDSLAVPEETADARARRLAVDPARHVALEASAGTGKTRVLVDRYVRLLEAGVAPRNILAITFTRKARRDAPARDGDAARAAARGRHHAARWREIATPSATSPSAPSTLSPVAAPRVSARAGVDPGFDLADETRRAIR
jgi:ATP-dependent helicase/nuclease subunit A